MAGIAAVVVALGLNGGPAGAQTLRAANLKPDPSSAEAGLWGAADRAEQYVRTSADLDADPELTAFVHRVVCKIATEYCGELRVYVLDRPVFNASAAPNGYVEVNSGLLLRARTEDEVAFVLGHEVSHFARNHSLERWSQMKNTANMVMVLQVGVAAGAAVAMASSASSGAPGAQNTVNSISSAASSLNNLIYLAGLASIYSFSRENESEADRLGYQRAAAAGYDKAAGVRMWRAVVAENQASDFPKVRKAEARASMFNTHPLSEERIEALKAMSGGADNQADPAAEHRYRAVIRAHLDAWLKDDLRRRDYGQTLYVIDQLLALGEDKGVLSFYRAEALRQRRGDGDSKAALSGYQNCVGYPDAPPAAWRELGDALLKAGQRGPAAEAYRTYLARAGDADDRWIVEESLKTLNGADPK